MIVLCPKMIRRINIPFMISEESREIAEIPPPENCFNMLDYNDLGLLVLLLFVREVTRLHIFDIVRDGLGHNGV